MKVCFPDTMGVETRWQTAFYDMDVICDPTQASAIFPDGTHQGIWWPNNQGGAWYVMADGTSRECPSPQALRRSRRSRSTTPGARRP